MWSPPMSISHRHFRCRYSNSRDVIASSPSFCQSALESLPAGYFLRTPSTPITTGVVSISIFHLLALSVHIIRLQAYSWAAQITTDASFSSGFHLPLMSTPSSSSCLRNWTWILFSLYDFTSSSTAPFLYYSGFTGASKSTIIVVWSSPVLFLGILSHVSAAIPQVRDITRHGQYQGWLDSTSPARQPLHSPRQLKVHQSWWVLLSLYS